MYISKLNKQQIIEMLKKMMLQEARLTNYYQSNLAQISDGTLFDYQVIKNKQDEYIVCKIPNGDLFIFDDCNYIKFEMPSLHPIALQRNTNVYNNFMRTSFADFHKFEKEYNENTENIVNFVNFCDEQLQKYKQHLHTCTTAHTLSTPAPNNPRHAVQSKGSAVEY